MHTYIYVFMKTDLINIHIISIVDNFISENEKRLNWNPLFIHRHDSNNRPVSSFIQNIQIRRRRMFRSPKNIITIYCFFLGLFLLPSLFPCIELSEHSLFIRCFSRFRWYMLQSFVYFLQLFHVLFIQNELPNGKKTNSHNRDQGIYV